MCVGVSMCSRVGGSRSLHVMWLAMWVYPHAEMSLITLLACAVAKYMTFLANLISYTCNLTTNGRIYNDREDNFILFIIHMYTCQNIRSYS